MKRASYLVAAIFLTLGSSALATGCNAFSEEPIEYNALSSMNLLPEEGGGEEAPASASPSVSSDVAACEAVTSISVTASDRQMIQSSSGWSTTGTVTATVVTGDAVAIKIAGDSASLSFTVHKMGDKEYGICSVSYSTGGSAAKHAVGLNDETAGTVFEVVGGSLMVDQFGAGGDASVVNAGSYQLTFKPGSGAAKAIGALVGAKSEENVTLQGTYYTDKLEQAAK